MVTETKYSLKLEIGNLVFPETKTVKNKDDKEEIEHEHNLYGVRFNRQIYQPGVIEAEISIKPKPDVPTVIKSLLKKNVTLLKDEVPIAENYYVHEILPQEKKGVTEQLFMKLTIFSKDKLMTLDKYSKVYVAKKLGSEILDVERKNFTPENDEIKVNFANMRMLKYNHTRVITNPMSLKSIVIKIASEFIHPYLVQYNESFYDFLARTANRCGEFLYFEDGKLNLGLPMRSSATFDAKNQKTTVQPSPILIDKYSSVTYQNISAGPLDIDSYARDSIKDRKGEMEGTNYDVVKKNSAGYPTDAFPDRLSYNSELAQDEYFFPLYADKFSTFTREMGLAGDASAAASTQIFPLLNQLMSGCTDVTGFLVSYGINEAMTIKNSISTASESNVKGFNKYIDVAETNTNNRAKKLEQGDGKLSAVPFGTLSPEGWTTLNYYHDVRKYEEEVQLRIICIDMDTDYVNVKLGDRIKLSDAGEVYTVIQIVMEDNTKWTHSYAKYNGEVIPKTRETQNQLIFAIPDRQKTETDDENTNLSYPPVLDVPIVRKAEPQTAFIADNDDPKYQGRVRIVYPWQTESSGKLKDLPDAEEKYAQAQKILEVKRKKLAQLQAELDRLNDEKNDLQNLHEEKDRNNSLKKREWDLALTSAVILSLDNKISDINEKLKKEKDKAEKKQDKKKIKALELEIVRAKEEQEDHKLMQAEQQAYVDRLRACQNDTSKLLERKNEIDALIKNVDDSGNLQGKEKERDDMQKEVEKAEADVKNKAKDVENKAADGMKALSSISSPWIRVTTPMATEGGGTFFKPRVGDEVLVNYENGNVERPYVIGSLFSKNVLVPDERINRTVSPNLYANASIAIVSPNGHGITFKDPSSGDGFISGVYPGLGVVTDFISKVPMPHTKDLAGGIKIGDRYGLYSISMSSDKRSISISSSLGKVTMNAFTGITISAPNGDVKIVGKNVSISAGNNLSITSGTNIKGADYEYKRDTKGGKVAEFITEKLANVSVAVDKFVTPFIDTTLARAALEVFLRPIEGTLCVKSKRYLTLEAGSGKAIIKPDRFKKFDANRTDKENDFFKRMIDCLTIIGTKVDAYCDTYNNLWKDAFAKYTDYVLKASFLLKNPNDPNILKDIIDNYVPKRTDYQESFFKGKLDPGKVEQKISLQGTKLVLEKTEVIRENKDKPSNLKTLCKLINAVAPSVAALFDHMTSIASLIDDVEKPTYIEKTLMDTLVTVAFDGNEMWEDVYYKGRQPTDMLLKTETPSSSDIYGNPAFLKRRWAAMFIMKVAKHPEQVSMQFIETKFFLKEKNYEAQLKEDNLTDNYWWSKFVMNFEGVFINTVLKTLLDNTVGSAVESFKQNIGSLNPIESIAAAPEGTSLKDRVKSLKDRVTLKDRDVWAAGKGGQILFSDQKDATLNFDGGDLKKEDYANRYNIDKMKKVLSGM